MSDPPPIPSREFPRNLREVWVYLHDPRSSLRARNVGATQKIATGRYEPPPPIDPSVGRNVDRNG